LKEWLLNQLFKISSQKIEFNDLVRANALLNEGMLVDPAKLGYTLRTLRAYIIFALLCAAILVPLLLATHYIFTLVDFHLSIISAVVVTALVFMGYDAFKIYTRKIISKELIKRAWSEHFPCFEYEKYSKIIEKIYNKATGEAVPKNQLESYILDKIITEKDENER